LAQESSTRIGANQIQMLSGVPSLSPSRPHRERSSQVVGLSLSVPDMPGDTGHGNLRRGDPRFGSGAEPCGRLQTIFPVNIAIADKNPMVLSALEALLTRDRRFNLLLIASDGVHFLNSLVHLPVSLGVIGWELPPIRAPEILQALAKRPDSPKVVVYSGTRDAAAPAETLRLGGAGFVSKLSPPERLLEVFAAVAAGDMVFPFADIHKVRPNPLTSLTHRERDLLAALETGRSNAQLAREFGVSINTVKFHLRNLFGKLDVRNRTQAICLYLETRR
jgi:two-component system nitrate/nitrite response regulator NarP